ncbi:MAG TPA: M20/M25/M40 family metallo-hydrolase [Kofleriaceae bacterium]
MGSWLARLEAWVRLHPVAGSRGHAQLADEIVRTLAAGGLSVSRHAHATGDLLVARCRGAGPLLGVYGHYDVAPGGRTDLLATADRVFGRGVGDNLGPLALRLSVLERYEGRANLLWVIEPGEEGGSVALADWFDSSGNPQVDLWLDETGYFDVGGMQRVLGLGITEELADVLRRCGSLAATMGRATRREERTLRRVVTDAASNVERLFQGAPYVALGPNDDHSDVHGEHESLPLDTIELSMRQFEVLLDMAAGASGR